MPEPHLIILSICFLLLLAYLFDVSSSKTRVPSVLLLLFVGWLSKVIVKILNVSIPDLSFVLPVLGTIGLILIVLEGSLELELNRSKLPLIGKIILFSLLPVLILSFALALIFRHLKDVPFEVAFANSVPFAVISSSVAISGAKDLEPKDREFIIYESSMSDIFGVVIFNFLMFNDNGIKIKSLVSFAFETLFVLIIAYVMTLVLAFLLSRIKHHVKFIPIIVIIIAIYSISKIYHLPALILILIFGLFLGNIDKIKVKEADKYFHLLQIEVLIDEVRRFKELTIELTFLVRSLFFLLFGYSIDTGALLNPKAVVWSIGISALIYALRFIFIKTFGLNPKPILLIAPRGLITILLFISVPVSFRIDLVDELITQVIVLTSLVMMFGTMKGRVSGSATDKV